MSTARGAPHLSRRISECLPEDVSATAPHPITNVKILTADQHHSGSSSEDEYNRKIEVSPIVNPLLYNPLTMANPLEQRSSSTPRVLDVANPLLSFQRPLRWKGHLGTKPSARNLNASFTN